MNRSPTRRNPFRRAALAAAVLCACGGGACGGGGTSDAGLDASLDRDAGTDAFVRTAPPMCPTPDAVTPPACGTGGARVGILGEDAELDAHARRFDRGFIALHAAYTGVNTEVVALDAASRLRIEAFLNEDDGYDFAAFDGQPIETAVSWAKVAGAYAGAGAAADAYRYAVLRDEGAACDEVDRARAQLHAALDGMHRAVAITGVRGVIARGYQRRDRAGFTAETVPLFDGAGNPLPPEKTNGTWRDDASGLYPEYAWEDSCSRDMLVGWVLGMAAAWEVGRNDPSIDAARLATLADDASAIAHRLMEVGSEGYDLEIHDADGRLTYHAYLHESAVDRSYLRNFRRNGQHAAMSLGILAALARISGDPEVADYLHNDLIRARDLPGIVRDDVDLIDFGIATNFSNYNMAYTGAWLAQRYLCDEGARDAVRTGILDGLYATPGETRQPVEMQQSFFDLVALAASAHGTADAPLDADFDASMLARATETLRAFPSPYWAEGRENCDAAELASLSCIGVDGTPLPLAMELARGDEVVATVPVPMRIRPPSNFMWRSDPYRVNGAGDPLSLYPAVDFRLAYWMARHLR
jgi:hypothetical protein